jgi:LPXTG-motif cell wall-anchored protein
MWTFWEFVVKKTLSLGLAAFAALVAVLAIMGSQSPAQAYPEVSIALSVNRDVLYSGQDFTATAHANVTCSWDLDWNGAVRKADERPNVDFVTTYTAPKVTTVTKIPLHGTCVYDATETASVDRVPTAWQRTIVITVLPARTAVAGPIGPVGPVGSDLPNTGGPSKLFLAGGVLLLLSGVTAVTVARRRAEQAEMPPFRA